MPELTLSQLTDDDQYRLRSFQTAADQVYRFWRPYRHHEFSAQLFRGDAPDIARLIPDPDFRALAVAVRLAYMKTERAHFISVVDALRPHLDAELLPLLEDRLAEWNRALSGRARFTFQHEGRNYSPRDVLDTWLYALTLHQDKKRQDDAQRLAVFDPMSSMTLQLMVCELAIAIINLDSMIRGLLGEAPRDLSVLETPSSESTGIF